MQRATTTTFHFDDGEYFVASTTAGGVRIGLKGDDCFDIPAGHAWFDRVREADSRPIVEALHDELVQALS